MVSKTNAPQMHDLERKSWEKRELWLRRVRKYIGMGFKTFIYVLILIIYLLPFAWMILGSLRKETELFANVYPLSWHTLVPIDWTLFNYQEIFGLVETGRGAGLFFQQNILNSLIVAVIVVSTSTVFSTMGAYFFTRLSFPKRLRNFLLIFMLISMLLPLETIMVPLYIVINTLGVANSYAGIVLPWIASPFFIFFMIQIMQSIPRELDEAATLDGASKWQIFIHVIVPGSVTGIITHALIEFQYAWNLFYWPLIVANAKELQLIQVVIAGQYNTTRIYWGRVFAGATVASIPLIILFLAMQNYYVQGISLTGMKG